MFQNELPPIGLKHVCITANASLYAGMNPNREPAKDTF